MPTSDSSFWEKAASIMTKVCIFKLRNTTRKLEETGTGMFSSGLSTPTAFWACKHLLLEDTTRGNVPPSRETTMRLQRQLHDALLAEHIKLSTVFSWDVENNCE